MLFYFFPFPSCLLPLPPTPKIRAGVCPLWWNTSVGLSVCPSPFWELLPHPHVYGAVISYIAPWSLRRDSERVSIGEKQPLWSERFLTLFFMCVCLYRSSLSATGQIQLHLDTALGPKDVPNHCLGMPILITN